MIVRLSRSQLDFLKYNLATVQDVFRANVIEENQSVVVEVDEETADEIRDWALDQLQIRGFDINYELTSEGKLLEEIIDLFYIGY